MICIGRTKSLKRCRNKCKHLFCGKHRLQWWTAIAVIATLIGLFRGIKDLVTLKPKIKEKIFVARIPEESSYLIWLKETFEKKYPDYEIVYVPGIGALNESSPERFQRLYQNKEVDVFLGGQMELHEERKDGLGNIAQVIQANRYNINHFDPGNKWIGYYQKFLGVVWNKEMLPPGYVIKSIKDLETYAISQDILIPDIKTSAASDFLIALGNKDTSIDLSLGMSRYKKLLEKYSVLRTQGPEAVKIVAKLKPEIAVEWPHDAIISKRELNFDCIGISIFDESVPGISCISVLKGAEMKKGVIEFLNFTLSVAAQQQHFNKSLVLPISDTLLKSCLKGLTETKELDYYPSNISSKRFRRYNVSGFLDSLRQVRIMKVSHQEIERTKLLGCGKGDATYSFNSMNRYGKLKY